MPAWRVPATAGEEKLSKRIEGTASGLHLDPQLESVLCAPAPELALSLEQRRSISDRRDPCRGPGHGDDARADGAADRHRGQRPPGARIAETAWTDVTRTTGSYGLGQAEWRSGI